MGKRPEQASVGRSVNHYVRSWTEFLGIQFYGSLVKRGLPAAEAADIVDSTVLRARRAWLRGMHEPLREALNITRLPFPKTSRRGKI